MTSAESMMDPSFISAPAKTKVLVVGAGFSGLAVAYSLRNDDNIEVQILEARDRIGGRVFPFEFGMDKKVQVDLGGQWVHEASLKNPLRHLIQQELGLKFVSEKQEELDDSSIIDSDAIFNQDGELITEATKRSAAKFYFEALDDYHEDEQIDPQLSFQDLLEQAFKTATASGDKDRFFNENFKQLLNYHRHQTECYEGGRLSELSVAMAGMYQNLGGLDELPDGGYHSVIQAIQEKLKPDTIETSCVVDCIEYNPRDEGTGVSVVLQDGRCFNADYCICTATLGVLQHRKIRFEPDLPRQRWDALDSMGMGLLDKVVLEFETKFWQEYDSFAMAHSDPSGVKSFIDNSHHDTNILMMFHGGDAALRVHSDENSLNDEECLHEVIACLRQIFGQEKVPEPLSYVVTRWNTDPFAYGAYSFTKVGSSKQSYKEIASPVGNLLFAGEHTSMTAHGCVHGAWMTGQREAQRIRDLVVQKKKDL